MILHSTNYDQIEPLTHYAHCRFLIFAAGPNIWNHILQLSQLHKYPWRQMNDISCIWQDFWKWSKTFCDASRVTWQALCISCTSTEINNVLATFSNAFFEWKYINFDSDFTEICSQWSNEQYSSTGADNLYIHLSTPWRVYSRSHATWRLGLQICPHRYSFASGTREAMQGEVPCSGA